MLELSTDSLSDIKCWYPGCHSGVVELRTGTLGVIQGMSSCRLVIWVSFRAGRAAYLYPGVIEGW